MITFCAFLLVVSKKYHFAVFLTSHAFQCLPMHLLSFRKFFAHFRVVSKPFSCALSLRVTFLLCLAFYCYSILLSPKNTTLPCSLRPMHFIVFQCIFFPLESFSHIFAWSPSHLVVHFPFGSHSFCAWHFIANPSSSSSPAL